MADDYLPTFNSHAIEARLPCSRLAENFVYFNDDVIAFDALAPADFVNENGTLNANLEARAVVNGEVKPNEPDYSMQRETRPGSCTKDMATILRACISMRPLV